MNATIIEQGIAVAQDPDTAWYEERRALAVQMLDGRACFLCGQPCEIPDGPDENGFLYYSWCLVGLEGGPTLPMHNSCSHATGNPDYARLEGDATMRRLYAAAVKAVAA